MPAYGGIIEKLDAFALGIRLSMVAMSRYAWYNTEYLSTVAAWRSDNG